MTGRSPRSPQTCMDPVLGPPRRPGAEGRGGASTAGSARLLKTPAGVDAGPPRPSVPAPALFLPPVRPHPTPTPANTATGTGAVIHYAGTPRPPKARRSPRVILRESLEPPLVGSRCPDRSYASPWLSLASRSAAQPPLSPRRRNAGDRGGGPGNGAGRAEWRDGGQPGAERGGRGAGVRGRSPPPLPLWSKKKVPMVQTSTESRPVPRESTPDPPPPSRGQVTSGTTPAS